MKKDPLGVTERTENAILRRLGWEKDRRGGIFVHFLSMRDYDIQRAYQVASGNGLITGYERCRDQLLKQSFVFRNRVNLTLLANEIEAENQTVTPPKHKKKPKPSKSRRQVKRYPVEEGEASKLSHREFIALVKPTIPTIHLEGLKRTIPWDEVTEAYNKIREKIGIDLDTELIRRISMSQDEELLPGTRRKGIYLPDELHTLDSVANQLFLSRAILLETLSSRSPTFDYAQKIRSLHLAYILFPRANVKEAALRILGYKGEELFKDLDPRVAKCYTDLTQMLVTKAPFKERFVDITSKIVMNHDKEFKYFLSAFYLSGDFEEAERSLRMEYRGLKSLEERKTLSRGPLPTQSYLNLRKNLNPRGS